MKLILKALIRFSIVFAVSVIIMFVIWLGLFMSEIESTKLSASLLSIFLSTIPIAIVLSAFLTFFHVNRQYHSYINGFLSVFLPIFLYTFVFAFIFRIVKYPIAENSFQPKVIVNITSWLVIAAKQPIFLMILTFLVFSLYITFFWCTTRISKERPIVGALISPCCAYLSLYFLNIISSKAVLGTIHSLKINISDTMITVIILAITTLFLFLIDLFFATKPSKGISNE